MKKEEGVAGSVLGGGSFLRREGVPGKKKEGTAGGVSGGGFSLDEKWCLVLGV